MYIGTLEKTTVYGFPTDPVESDAWVKALPNKDRKSNKICRCLPETLAWKFWEDQKKGAVSVSRCSKFVSTTNHRPQTTNHKPQTTTTDHKPQTTNHKPQTTNHKPQTTNHRPQTTNHKPWGLPSRNVKKRKVDCEFRNEVSNWKETKLEANLIVDWEHFVQFCKDLDYNVVENEDSISIYKIDGVPPKVTFSISVSNNVTCYKYSHICSASTWVFCKTWSIFSTEEYNSTYGKLSSRI